MKYLDYPVEATLFSKHQLTRLAELGSRELELDDHIEPLNPAHPLLARGLQESCASPGSPQRGNGQSLYGFEPDEHELILERLKRARLKPFVQQHALTARPDFGATSSG